MIQKIDKSKVLDFIKSSKVPVGKKTIVDATGYNGDFSWCIKSLMEENEEIQKAGTSRNATYIWNPKKTMYSEMKNSEGYSDGTAGKAIANVMKSSGKYPMRQHFGEVWAISNVVDDQEGVLIISAKENTCICYTVYPCKKSFMKPDYTLRWTDDTGTHYISTINPVNLSERKLGKKLYDIGSGEKECLRKSLMAALDIVLPEPETKIQIVEKKVEVPVEVEKEVIKEVPVEVERIVEKEVYRTDPTEIEMAVLRAKCEIYEKIIFSHGVTNSINTQNLQAV